MREVIKVTPAEPTILLTTDVVYDHRIEFCGAQYQPLKLSVLRPRIHFPHDPASRPHTIVFLCGGGWAETDHNAWLPELSWFAKRGYAVASVQYPVTAVSRFPDSIRSVKTAIDFLCDHARQLYIDMEHMAIMGESAGAYLALLCAACDHSGKYGGSTNHVDAAVALYPPISPDTLRKEAGDACPLELPLGAELYPSLLEEFSPAMPPTMLLHGTSDDLVPVSNSRRIYEQLQSLGVHAELTEIEEANHADYRFFQTSVKEKILSFLNNALEAEKI